MGIIFGLLASISFALFFTFIKRSYEEFPPSIAFFFDMLFGLILWIPFSLIIGFNFSDLPLVFFFAALSALLSEAFSFYVISKGEVSLTGTVFSTYPIYTILFSHLMLSEKLTTNQWVFIIFTVLGTIIASLPSKISLVDFRKKTFLLWALAGAIAAGFSDTLSKTVIDKTSAATFLFALAICQIPLSIAYLRIEKQKLSQFKNFISTWKKYYYSIIGSFFSAFGLIFLWLAFEYTKASIASPLTGSYPALMVILAIFWLKERPSKLELSGLMLAIFGVVGISFFQ